MKSHTISNFEATTLVTVYHYLSCLKFCQIWIFCQKKFHFFTQKIVFRDGTIYNSNLFESSKKFQKINVILPRQNCAKRDTLKALYDTETGVSWLVYDKHG